MKDVVWYFLILPSFFMGAVQHERDLARNFNGDGDGDAWFVEIKCNH